MQLLQASIAHVLIKNITSASQQITARQFETARRPQATCIPERPFRGEKSGEACADLEKPRRARQTKRASSGAAGNKLWLNRTALSTGNKEKKYRKNMSPP